MHALESTHGAALLGTKLAIPPLREEIVSRGRLLDELENVDRVPLTVVAAPAGFGKTTLVSAWAISRSAPVAWVSLDVGDNDAVRFWRYVGAAFDTVHAGAAHDLLDLLQAPVPPATAALVPVLYTALCALPPGSVLVLDDYHVITERSIHEVVGALVDRLPTGMHLLLATRVDPPIPLARLRARAQLLEVRAADLRFTTDEAAQFLGDGMHLDLGNEDIQTLDTRVEGWAAGLQLAALALRGQQNPSRFITSFAGNHRFVLDFLAEEVIHTQPDDVRRFLIRTGVLDRLTANLCDAVTGEANGQEMLEYAERANLFVLPLDDSGQWYRYHHLFAEVLRGLLKRESTQAFNDAHCAASAWYERQNLPDEAIGHAFAAGAHDRVVDLIDWAGWIAIWRKGGVGSLRRWICALPDDVVRRNGNLCLLMAWVLVLLGPHTEVDKWLEAAAATRPDDPRQAEALDARIAVPRAMMTALYGDVATSLALSGRAIDNLPVGDLMNRAVATYSRGLALWFDGQPRAAHDALAEAASLYQRVDADYTVQVALGIAAHQLELAGDVRAAEASFASVLKRATDGDGRLQAAACTPAILSAHLLLELNRLDEAWARLEEGIALGQRTRNTEALCTGYLVRAAIHHARGDLVAAQVAVESSAGLVPVLGLGFARGYVAAYQGELLLARGDLAGARHWMAEQEVAVPSMVTIAQEQVQTTIARVALATGDPSAALVCVDSLLAAAETAGRAERAIHLLGLRALILQHLENDTSALRTLHEAVTRAHRHGFVRTIAEHGPVMSKLLRSLLLQLVRDEAEPDLVAYVRMLITASAAETLQASLAGLKGSRSSGEPSPLTERELEVIRLIARGDTNAQIAAEMVVEVSTVKRHINNIYTKLDAENRTGAVVRARALGLLKDM